MKRALALALAALAACSEPAPPAPAFDVYPVVEPRLAELEAAAGAELAPPEAPPEPDPELAERVEGLLASLPHARGAMRELQLEDAGTLGPHAVPLLAAALGDPGRPPEERQAACEVLALLDTPEAARRLVEQVEGAPESWLRATAVWQLGRTSQDFLAPRLVLRLKYESDEETVIWMAWTLARFGSYAGLDGLFSVQRSGSTEALRQSAAARLAELAAEAGLDDPARLWELWRSGDPDERLPARTREAPGAARRLALWRLVAGMSGEHFQLRGVDDSRFALSREGPWAAEPLAAALHDEDVYVRLHVAQVLERMGGRARAAGPTLVAALDEPGIAHAAAAALGEVWYPPAGDALAARLGRAEDPELRTAAARALGRLGVSEHAGALRGLLVADEPLDLRQTAAHSLVALGRGDEVARFLLACLRDPGADVAGAEAALGRWLEDLAGRDRPGAAEALEAWRAESNEAPFVAPLPEEVAARRAARAELLEARLPELVPAG